MQNILVIKLGALGDFITALGPMQAIRTHHPAARITLLTTKPYESLARDCGYFDDVWLDTKPKWFDLGGWKKLRLRLNAAKFDRVYDLQNNDRTELYLRLFSPRPEWVGAAKGASHRNASPERNKGRAFDGHAQTLSLAGIDAVKPDDLSWMKPDMGGFALERDYILFIPGSSPQHPQKRWPAASYRSCIEILLAQGYQAILLGSEAEATLNEEISRGLPVLNLTGKTGLYDIAGLARGAAGALGNDTGPSHMIAVTGCPILMLYATQASTIRKHGPVGANAAAVERDDLSHLSVDTVMEKFKAMIRKAG